MNGKPVIRGIVETCMNVADMNRARRFYESVFGFEAMVHDERFCAFRVGSDVLLLFTQGGSDQPTSAAVSLHFDRLAHIADEDAVESRVEPPKAGMARSLPEGCLNQMSIQPELIRSIKHSTTHSTDLEKRFRFWFES